MAEAFFYHLTESTLEQALPPLLEKSLQRGWNVVVQAGSEERRDALDIHLWTYRDDSFLAHGTDRDAHPADQAVLLTTADSNLNDAKIRFIVDGASPPDLTPYERAVFMFDGHDAAQLEAARRHWKETRAAGHAVTYWQQTSGGRWERQA
ncbi:DNA polymerase III subunit chi [Arvimicrobium flavum]|uniref:DNA polymerase III subunit chi n=1 Tax=Arvimicrobium flavum TaxID=3393320 RepID=UPI00237B1A38|nr:DNA polymerase III subunit chi [Mesorhizobium shangrilense]